MMFTSHLHLIINGKSTVESFGGREQQENEAAVLQKEYGYLWHNQEKRAVKKRWKEEWGGLNPDERWRWGSKTQMWEQEMGKSWVGWICEPSVNRACGRSADRAQCPLANHWATGCISMPILALDQMASG